MNGHQRTQLGFLLSALRSAVWASGDDHDYGVRQIGLSASKMARKFGADDLHEALHEVVYGATTQDEVMALQRAEQILREAEVDGWLNDATVHTMHVGGDRAQDIIDWGFPADLSPGHITFITNPFTDRAGRPCSPEYWGFRHVSLGGGINGYELIWDGEEEERYVLTTADPGPTLPSANDWALAMYVPTFGEYGEEVPQWMVTREPNTLQMVLRVWPDYYDYQYPEDGR